MFLKEVMCQFHELLLEGKEDPHGIFMNYGIQAGTLKTYPSSNNEPIDPDKLSKYTL